MKRPEVERSLDHVTQLDWARLAAFIDGEGSILINRFSVKAKSTKKFSMWLRLILVNTDIRMPKWCYDTFGGVLIHEPRANARHRDCFRWHVSCKTAELLIRGCLPYLLCKREEAVIALAYQETLGGPGIRVSEETRKQREQLRSDLHSLKRNTETNYRVSEEFLVIEKTREQVLSECEQRLAEYTPNTAKGAEPKAIQ